MIRPALLALAVGFVATPLRAQITLTADDFRAQTGASFTEWYAGNGHTALPEDLTALEGIIRSAGTAAVFDFSSITPILGAFSENEYIALPADSLDLPGYAGSFLDRATDVWKVSSPNIPDVFIYRRITNDSLAWLGNGLWQDTNQDDVPDAVVSRFAPAKLQAALPLALGVSWQSDITHLTVVSTPLGVFEVPGVQEVHDIAVDGYGTLVTHQGQYPCLRIRINQTITHLDGTVEELGGWSYLTADLVQLGVFYSQLVPADPTLIDFDIQQPKFITLFGEVQDPVDTAVAAGYLPTHMLLESNFPNPFQQSTTIPFTLEAPAHVRLQVFDMLGRTVDTVLDETRAPGHHRAVWQPAGLASGLYLYRFEFDGVGAQRIMHFID